MAKNFSQLMNNRPKDDGDDDDDIYSSAATDDQIQALVRGEKIKPLAKGVQNSAKKAGLPINEKGTIVYKGFHLTANGLAPDSDGSQEDWEEFLSRLIHLWRRIQLFIGDMLVRGELEYGVTYEQVAEQFGVDVKTLQNWKYVAGSVEYSLRRENLTKSHYELVAGFDPDAQQHWIDRAADNGWTVKALRENIAANQLPKEPDPPRATGSEKYAQVSRRIVKTADEIAAGRSLSEREKERLIKDIETAGQWLGHLKLRLER